MLMAQGMGRSLPSQQRVVLAGLDLTPGWVWMELVDGLWRVVGFGAMWHPLGMGLGSGC